MYVQFIHFISSSLQCGETDLEIDIIRTDFLNNFDSHSRFVGCISCGLNGDRLEFSIAYRHRHRCISKRDHLSC